MAIQKMLVPTDGSVFSRRATSLAVELAKPLGAHVVALHVISLKPPKMLEANELEKEKVRQAETCFADAKEQADKNSVSFEGKLVAGRDVEEAIIEEIGIEEPDLIVIGSHGLTGLKKLLLGSVAEAVLKKSTVPVLVVK